MAARAKKVEADDSSSSDEEELRRCQDAVWETPSDKTKGKGFSVMFVVRNVTVLKVVS